MTSNTDPVVRLYEFLYLGKTDITSGIEKPTDKEKRSSRGLILFSSLLIIVATVVLGFNLEKWANWEKTTESDTFLEKRFYDDQKSWQEATTQNTADSYAKYLKDFPEGHYVRQAQKLLFGFYNDQKSWKEAFTQDTADGYAKYLKDFPEGHYVRQARKLYNDKISKVLRECQRHLQAKRLTTGKGGTAFACYNKILKSDPNNANALAGLKKIEDRYVKWAKKALRRGQKNKAKRYLDSLRLVNPNSLALAKLEAQL